MAKINIFGTLNNVTGDPIVNANQVGSGTNTSEGELMMQDTINSHLMEGKIYQNGEWVSNTSAPTAATTTTLGGIKVAYVRPLHKFQTTQGGEDTIGNRYYGVEIDKDGKAFVHVPWVHYALGTASHEILGGVMTGDNTGIKVENQVIKADFDTTNYSTIEDPTTYNYETAKVASPDTVKQIMESYNKVFLETLGDVEAARLNLYNAIYGSDYTETSQIPVE